ncbi:unnamed protein product, partial [Amoebophrya sp. A120]|eukprot:GSA120T00014269001.1
MSWKSRKREESCVFNPVAGTRTGTSQEDSNLAESLDFQWVTTSQEEHQSSSSSGGVE